MSGWVKIHRRILDWQWYQDTVVFRVFAHCIFKANFTDKEWLDATIKRGSFVTSLLKLSDEIKLSVMQVRRALNCLSKTGEISVKTTNKYTVISVSNYDTYQVEITEKDKQKTNKEQTEDKQRTTTKEYKNIRKKEETNTGDKVLVKNLFEQFWLLYDKKLGKEKCYSLFSKIPEKEYVKIIDHVPKYVLSTPDKQYRKNPETYLRNRSWNDEIVVEKAKTSPKQSKQNGIDMDALAESRRKAGFGEDVIMKYDPHPNNDFDLYRNNEFAKLEEITGTKNGNNADKN